MKKMQNEDEEISSFYSSSSHLIGLGEEMAGAFSKHNILSGNFGFLRQDLDV